MSFVVYTDYNSHYCDSNGKSLYNAPLPVRNSILIIIGNRDICYSVKMNGRITMQAKFSFDREHCFTMKA